MVWMGELRELHNLHYNDNDSDLDISDYFGLRALFASAGRNGGNITIEWAGPDSHLALADTGPPAGKSSAPRGC